MHRQLRKLLDNAIGEQAFVIAINLDIRDFSAWSRRVESAQSSLYLKKIFPKLLDLHFSDEWFFKLTGDGLLLVRPFVESELPALVESTLQSALEIVDSFGSLCEDEPMVNFEVPDSVGIGIAQGAASRLVSDGLTLDYSGRVLNLASRLMELARPRGIVIDQGFGANLIPDGIASRFEKATGYIRGVAPDEPITILYLKEVTEIPLEFTQRPHNFGWKQSKTTQKLARLSKMGRINWGFSLSEAPTAPDLITVSYRHSAVGIDGKRLIGQQTTVACSNFKYSLSAGKPTVRVPIHDIVAACSKRGVKPSWEIEIRVDYPVTAETTGTDPSAPT
jgi:hypothetical protein